MKKQQKKQRLKRIKRNLKNLKKAKAHKPSPADADRRGQDAHDKCRQDAHNTAKRAHETAAQAAKLISEEGEAETDAREKTGAPYAEWLAGLSDEELQSWQQYGQNLLNRLDFSLCGVFSGRSGPLDDAEVQEYLSNGVRFLNQVVMLTSVVLDTVDVAYLRRIVAEDCRPENARHALASLGVDPDQVFGVQETAEEPVQKPEGVDHRKQPRGRRHPLLSLIDLAVKSVRQINQITRGTNPYAHDRLPVLEREARRDAFRGIAGAIREIVHR